MHTVIASWEVKNLVVESRGEYFLLFDDYFLI